MMEQCKKREIRTLRRLTEAEGYLEMGMPSHALARLEGIDHVGPLRGAVEMLRGKAFWIQRKFEDAANSLQFAAENVNSPLNRPAWLALSWYHRNQGQTWLAIEELARARGAQIPDSSSFGEDR
jgi:tetratricopeptide (TPR) repeat protein